ncbi:hypothetical protein [[Actinomadura] parvosata]|uniref:hypothetical protein n=1 Tax=[Actinomadura] parvosata TaxID=1955412 RepID=UPI0012BB4D0A|nr:hypothetical protein [Nonomuraea sp. ATCC 55076]
MSPTHPEIIATPLSLRAVREMGKALETLGVPAEVHDGYGLALVSVWVGLVVWCDGERYWWRAGWDPHRRRVIYAYHPVLEPERAARRVASRYSALRANRPLPVLNSEASASVTERAT